MFFLEFLDFSFLKIRLANNHHFAVIVERIGCIGAVVFVIAKAVAVGVRVAADDRRRLAERRGRIRVFDGSVVLPPGSSSGEGSLPLSGAGASGVFRYAGFDHRKRSTSTIGQRSSSVSTLPNTQASTWWPSLCTRKRTKCL